MNNLNFKISSEMLFSLEWYLRNDFEIDSIEEIEQSELLEDPQVAVKLINNRTGEIATFICNETK